MHKLGNHSAFEEDPFYDQSITIIGRVKRWRGKDMIQRWAAAALLQAEKKFRREKGYKELPKLAALLQQKSIDEKEVAA